jgi:2-dehydro-3-deoxyphosphogluconate aldolase/(4S)-4-hydroxy-2-oxoglutarate aldolase
MARFDRLTVLNSMVSTGLVPIFYHRDAEVAQKVIAACAEGGSALLEFTNRGDRALNVFTEMAEFCDNTPSRDGAHSPIILGAGSIVDAPTAALYIAAGANFIVGPMLNPEVARLCNRRKVPYLPGCGTVSEISQAEELGAEIVKIFPGGEMGGPAFVRSVLAPMPWTRIMPTGGIEATEESVKAWIKAGVACLGVGGQLIRKDLLEAGDYAAIRDNVRRVLQWIKEARAK